MKNQENQYALITGAASGFGKEFARIFAGNGYHLVLVDKQSALLNEVEAKLKGDFPAVQIVGIAQDLAEDGAAQQVYDAVKAKNIQVDVLINNAGFGEQGAFVESEWEKEKQLIHTNVMAVVDFTKLYLKEMVRRNDGKILQVASTASFMPCPNLSVYGASKAFVLSFSEAVQYEIKDSDVTLTILCPGASDTNFFAAADATNTPAAQDTPLTDAYTVAKAGFDALMSGKKREVVGTMNEFQVAMSNVIPDSWLAAMTSKLFKEKEAA